MAFKYKIQVLLLSSLLLITGSCKDFIDINEDPNNPTTAALELLLPATQVSMAGGMKDINDGTSVLVQHLYTTATSRNFQDGTDYQQSWNGLYTQVLNDLEIIIKEGTAQQRWGYVTIAKLQKAYIYSIMVDMWGDIPYSESSQASTIENPAFEAGAEIYDKLFALIDEAIADAEKGAFSILPATADIMYRGNKDNWIRMGNSLKLKLFNQIRLVDPGRAKAGIDALLSGNAPLISNNSQDFSFRFGSSETPANRHPWHRNEYQATKAYYMSQGFMLRLFNNDDPRLRYYFFRQNATATVGNGNNGNGYFGRFTGDPTGVPNDNARRTTVGVYPSGGLYDNSPINNIPATHVFVTNTGTNSSFKVVGNRDGSGAGILPLITSSMVKFILAEAALTLGTGAGTPNGDPRQLLKEGIEANLNSINMVSTTSGNTAPLMPPGLISEYSEKIAGEYDLAADTGKLETVMTQKYIALYGNGMEAYNDYRRTGLPVLPAPQAPLSTFPLRLAYSVTELSTNTNVSASAAELQTAQQTTPVFWDIN